MLFLWGPVKPVSKVRPSQQVPRVPAYWPKSSTTCTLGNWRCSRLTVQRKRCALPATRIPGSPTWQEMDPTRVSPRQSMAGEYSSTHTRHTQKSTSRTAIPHSGPQKSGSRLTSRALTIGRLGTGAKKRRPSHTCLHPASRGCSPYSSKTVAKI